MKRRQFLASVSGLAAVIPTVRTAALDVDIIESPIMEVLRMLPDRPGADGFDFPVITATNNNIQRDVWPENPEMYWDPAGEDYLSIFAFHPSWWTLSTAMDGALLSQFNQESYDQGATIASLETNGWEIADQDLNLLRYAGNDEDRRSLASTLNLLGSQVREGLWDWIALPDAMSIITGPDEDLVRLIASRVQNQISTSSVDENFPQIRYVLRHDTYRMALVPPQRLPIQSAEAAFVSRSWTGDVPIIHSIGVHLESADLVEPLIDVVRGRLESESSNIVGTTYAEFLELQDVRTWRRNVRFDLVDASGEWDVLAALEANDLQMLPLP